MDSNLGRWWRMQRMGLGAAWRRQRAMEYVASDKVRMPGDFDVPTRHAAGFFRLNGQGEHGKVAAREKYPDMALAAAAWDQPELRAAVQTLVVANVTAAEICELLNLQPSVLQIIEDVYFDVRSMLSMTHWIVAQVISAEADAGHDDVAAQLRVAYFGGPFVGKALIDAKLHLPTEPAQQLGDAALLLHAKFVQALAMPLSPEHQMEFLKLTAEIRRDEQRLQLERDKLACRLQRWTQRYALVQARSSAAQEDSRRAMDKEATAVISPK